MSNALNKNHPFRESITHSSSESAGIAPSASVPFAENSEKKTFSASSGLEWFAGLKPKSKLILIALVGGSMGYGYVLIYDLLNPQNGGLLSQKRRTSKSAVVAQYRPEELGERSVDRAWKKAGILQRLLCRGGERRSFCD